jgi:glycerol-3-phosphate acyltransferase PlsX
MGGDHAPFVTVKGAVLAAREYGLKVVLVGQQSVLEKELSRHGEIPKGVTLHHASEVVGMDEPAAVTIRKKKDSSIGVALDLVKRKEADAFVSAGNTGAAVVATVLTMGLLKGIERPGIAIAYPTLKGHSVLIDIGANIDAKPEHLLQHAVMGSIYFNYLFHEPSPSVGLLNIGEEDTKGPDFMKETHKLLGGGPVNFIGNVEGRDIFNGKVDVIVCDGFVGNIVLKVTESLTESTNILLRREIKAGGLLTMLGGLLIKSGLSRMRERLDYTEFGGAPLLGTNSVCIIGHGSSSAKAIKNAIRVAGEFVTQRVNEHIQETLERFHQEIAQG